MAKGIVFGHGLDVCSIAYGSTREAKAQRTLALRVGLVVRGRKGVPGSCVQAN